MMTAYKCLTELVSMFMSLFLSRMVFDKNILQELAQSEGFILPVYKTENSGEPHNLSFISSVEVGETFQGTTAKSKKQAESNAARAAYTALMELSLDKTCRTQV